MQNKRIIVLLLILAVLPFSSFASDWDVSVLLTKAEEAFRQGNDLLEVDPERAEELYDASIVFYSSIIENGVKNAGLFYNIGNAYYRTGRIGYAVLNYRRALLLSPDDSLIQSNLEAARGLQKNNFTAELDDPFYTALLVLQGSMSVWWKAVLLLVFNLAFWLCIALRKFIPGAFWLCVLCAAGVSIFSVAIFADWQLSNERHAVIVVEEAIGRKGDSLSYEAAFSAPLYQGLEVKVKQYRIGWIHAALPSGEEFWISDKDCVIIEEM